MGKHKEWRKLAKKARRKRIRQQKARERDEFEAKEQLQRAQSPTYQACLKEQQQAEEFQAKEEKRLAAEAEQQWLKKEEEAQKHWKELQEKLALAREERAKQAARIKEEWDREQKRLRHLKELQEKEEEKKHEEQLKVQEEINNFIQNGGEIPEGLKTQFETNPTKPLCPFFRKTGACRFKDTCSRNHIRPGVSRVLLIPNFYSHYSLQQMENEHGSDSSLEFEGRETYEHFKEFFYDVLPEMETCGRVRQFKVCCNHEIHLRGNVYVEYSSNREAVKSYKYFYGRWYGGKQLHVEFCNIESWKSAICGLFSRQRCPKGSSCNFLHVFTNPGNLFSSADKDLHRTPPSNHADEDGDSEARHWRWSESPEPVMRHVNGRSNKSKETRKRGRSRSRGRSKRNHRSESRSRERKRSAKKRRSKSRRTLK